MRVYPRLIDSGLRIVKRVFRRRWREWLLGGLLFAAIAAVALQPPIPQPLAYHDFADHRMLYGIPHFWNVVSNLPFTVIGVFGCWWVIRTGRISSALEEPRERLAYVLFFVGGILTGVGSAYYHADPTNGTLVWDRLPLSVMLMSMFSIVVGEFVDRRFGRLMLMPLVILGICSVVYWAHTESLGRGDLRPYLLVQFYPMLTMLVILLLFRSRYTGGTAFWLLLALYAVAKIAETSDRAILETSGFWSGHTIKHCVAAVASYVPLYWLQHRTALRSTRTRIPSRAAEILSTMVDIRTASRSPAPAEGKQP
jgi:hypothetical protein